MRSIEQGTVPMACTDVSPETMFPAEDLPNDHLLVEDAKAVCRGCSLRAACLESAMRNREEFGVWGGLTKKERDALRRRTNRRLQAIAARTPSMYAYDDDPLFEVTAS